MKGGLFEMRWAVGILALLGAACDAGCPDLALPAMLVSVDGIDVDRIRVTATRSGASVLDDGELSLLDGVAAGDYRLVFTLDGTAESTLESVCTVGMLTGCDAEEATPNATPSILLTLEASQFTATLQSNGRCP